MGAHISRGFLLCISLFTLIGGSLISSSMSLRVSQIPSYGKVTYPILVYVSVDFSKVIATNNLSLGTQIAHEWSNLVKYPELQNKLVACKFTIVRFFVYHVQPCVNWDETTKTGTYDWSKFDQLMQTIQNMGVKNILVCVGYNAPNGLPPGMNRNYNNTGFPDPESFTAYCKDIALHVKDKGWSVRYWEPYNEPYQVFSNDTTYKTFVELFNAASDAVLEVFPDVLFGVDISDRKSFLDRFVYDGRNVGFLSFHKYDAWGTWLYHPEGYYSDDEVLRRASILGDYYRYTPQEMRDKWRSIRGEELPVFCTETNLNSAWINGTDPRIQEVVGAAWYAEVLRAFILSDIKYSVYFHFASDDSPRWEVDKQTKGYGFGMVNMAPPHVEWYPYLVNNLFGNHLREGDEIYICSSSNSTVVSALAWSGNGTYNVLLIGKAKEEVKVNIDVKNATIVNGLVSIFKIGGSSPKLEMSKESFVNPFSIVESGYFVMLLKIS